MTNHSNDIAKTIADAELAKYGIGEKPKPQPKPVFKTVRTKRPTTQTELFNMPDIPDFLKRKTVKSNHEDPTETMKIKLGVRAAELERMIKDDAFKMQHGKADAEIGRQQWDEFTQTIAKYIGQAMDARGLAWKSGHDWSLERGALVDHIATFIKDNGVFRDASGRNYIITVKGE
jgi:hypothetical protein